MRLLVHGDSIAATCPWDDLLDDDVEVVNRAVVGAKVRDLAGQFGSDSADAAVVSIGINDVTDWSRPLDLSGFAPAVADLRSRCGQVLIVAPQILFKPWESLSLRRLLVSRLRELRVVVGGEVVPYRVWDWQRDGIHLRASGRAKLAAWVAARLPVSSP